MTDALFIGRRRRSPIAQLLSSLGWAWHWWLNKAISLHTFQLHCFGRVHLLQLLHWRTISIVMLSLLIDHIRYFGIMDDPHFHRVGLELKINEHDNYVDDQITGGQSQDQGTNLLNRYEDCALIPCNPSPLNALHCYHGR